MSVLWTYRAVSDALAGMDVKGVRRRFNYPPESLNASDLPALWVQSPSGSGSAVVFERGGETWPSATVQVVLAVTPVAAASNQDNYLATVDAVDALVRELVKFRARGPASWQVRQTIVTVAGTDYWAAVADVEVKL